MADNKPPDDADAALEITPVRIERASSDRLSYSQVEVIHETSRKRVTAVPYFVDRTSGRSVDFKIRTEERKKDASGIFAWFDAEQKSLNLTESAAVRLADFIRRSTALARQGANGDFIVIPVHDGVADVAALDPGAVSRAVASILHKHDIVAHLANQDLGPELVTALRGAIRLRELRTALSQLRQMLNDGVTQEAEYQKWCEKHSWAFGSAALVPDTVRQIALGDEVDFLVPSSLTGLRDLIELKRPSVSLLLYDKSHRNWHWSADVSQAIGQCHRYLDALQEAAGRGLRDRPEIVAYHPRATIVLGRSSGWPTEQLRALHGLNARLNCIQVMTYDQLLAQGVRMIESIAGPASDSVSDPEL